MEDISKAMLIGAGVVIAVLIVFFAVRMFRSAHKVAESYQESRATSEISAFNANFTKYIGDNKSTDSELGYANIYDIISLANFAWEYNCQMVVSPKDTEYKNDERLVHINLVDKNNYYILKLNIN